jgi:UDP-glucose 4-epimerase
MSGKKIAIVGANGFIGRNLTETLMRKPGLNVHLFGKSETNIFSDKLPYTQINLMDVDQVNRHFSDMDIVYYLASESIPSTSWEKPILEIEKNLIPFINFLECIAKLKVKKIVFVSSAGTIYGASDKKVTEDSNKKPFSPYGITKLTMEYYLNYFEAKYGLSHDIYRVSNVYGDGQNTSKGLGIINTFLEKIIREKKIDIFGNGENIRNYIYVKDVAELLCLSINSDTSQSNIYNLSSNDTLSIKTLVSIIKNVVKEDFEIEYRATRQSDNSVIDPDNSKITKALPGYKFSTIEEGIAKTYSYIKQNN